MRSTSPITPMLYGWTSAIEIEGNVAVVTEAGTAGGLAEEPEPCANRQR